MFDLVLVMTDFFSLMKHKNQKKSEFQSQYPPKEGENFQLFAGLHRFSIDYTFAPSNDYFFFIKSKL